MTEPQSPTEKRVIRTFTSAQWDGKRNHTARRSLAKLTPKRFWVGFVIFAILVNLGAFGAVVITLGVIAVVFKWLSVDKVRQKFVDDLIAGVNEAIIGLTGDPNAGLSEKSFRSLCTSGGHVSLPVNGVPGLELLVISDRPTGKRIAAISRAYDTARTNRVTVVATAPDYGTASFDRLLQATLDAD